MSKARNGLQRQIIEISKSATLTAQQRVIQIGTLLSKLEDTIAREKDEQERDHEDRFVPIADYETQCGELENDRKLLCDLYATYPQARGLIQQRTGKWFSAGANREVAYEGKDLSGTPEAEIESGPAMILNHDQMLEVFAKHKIEPADVDYKVVEEMLEKAWNQATPSSRWKIIGEEDPHKGHYDLDRERSHLALGKFTDDELANGAFMNYDAPFDVHKVIAGTQIAPISWMTGVKDRIRWLSRHLETALGKAKTSQEEELLAEIKKIIPGGCIRVHKAVSGGIYLELGHCEIFINY